MTRKRQAGDFFSTGNVLPSDVGSGHLGECVYRSPRGCTGTSLDAFCIYTLIRTFAMSNSSLFHLCTLDTTNTNYFSVFQSPCCQ